MPVFNIVLPIFLIVFLGFLLHRNGLVKADWVHVLNKFVYYVSLPALIVVSFWQVDWMEPGRAGLVAKNILGLLVFAAIIFTGLSFTRLKRELKAAFFLTCLVGNTVYMGFPLISAALGRDSFSDMVAAATAHLVIALVLSIMAAEFYVVRSKRVSTYIKDFVKNPLIISLAAGLALSLMDFRGNLADVVQKPLIMLGSTASPVALFSLGGFLHGKFYKAHFSLALASSAIKLLAFPLFLLLFSGYFNLPPLGTKVSVLVASMPVAVTAFVIAEKYRLDEAFVANAIVVSTAASVISITALLFGLV